ncbi:hypothetical protein DXG01_001073 [Tephrocybe rancida]|nr:hypothetical protein DXG01_001073 [Tephrocybe rancida]
MKGTGGLNALRLPHIADLTGTPHRHLVLTTVHIIEDLLETPTRPYTTEDMSLMFVEEQRITGNVTIGIDHANQSLAMGDMVNMIENATGLIEAVMTGVGNSIHIPGILTGEISRQGAQDLLLVLLLAGCLAEVARDPLKECE